jgi:hypothetical protein
METEECTILNKLCDKYGSDKGSMNSTEFEHPYNWKPHNYTRVYSELFYPLKEKQIALLEVGIGTNNPNLPSSMGEEGKPGASLRVWKDYFKNAQIYGADIDKDILFEEDRIKTGFIDQLNKDTVDSFFDNFKITPDIIIDDGLHTFEAAVSLFESSFKYLANGGIYVIEDISYVESITKYLKNSGYEFKIVKLEMEDKSYRADNNLAIIYKQ